MLDRGMSQGQDREGVVKDTQPSLDDSAARVRATSSTTLVSAPPEAMDSGTHGNGEVGDGRRLDENVTLDEEELVTIATRAPAEALPIIDPSEVADAEPLGHNEWFEGRFGEEADPTTRTSLSTELKIGAGPAVVVSDSDLASATGPANDLSAESEPKTYVGAVVPRSVPIDTPTPPKSDSMELDAASKAKAAIVETYEDIQGSPYDTISEGIVERPGSGVIHVEERYSSVTDPSGGSIPPEEEGSGESAAVSSVTPVFVTEPQVTGLPPLPPTKDAHREGAFLSLSESETARWKANITAYEREAKALGEVPEAAALYLEIGRIYEEKIGSARNAANAYQTAFNLNSSDLAILHASRRLFAEVGNWPMVVQIIGYEIERAERPEDKATLFSEKATILEHQLRDLEGAQQAYEAALDAWSAEPIAIAALERIHLYNKSHEALFEVYERALEVEHETDRRLPLLLAAAHLAEDRLESPARAVALHEEALSLDPKQPVALTALRRLHQQAGHDEALVWVLERSAEATEDTEVASQFLLSAARVLCGRLAKRDDGLKLLLRGLDRTPNERKLLREVELLYRQGGHEEGLIEILRREASVTQESRDRAAVFHRLGRALERAGQLGEAAVAANAALDAESAYIPAAQALGRTLRALQKPEDLAKLYEREIEVETDPQERVIRLFKLAELQVFELQDSEAAIQTLNELLGVQREYPPARKLLEQLLVRKEAYEPLVNLYEEEVELTVDNDLKVFLLGRVGLLAEEKLQNYPRAQAAMRRLLELSPRHLGAIRSLNRMAELQGDAEEQLRLLELEAEATDDQAEALALMHRRAQLLAEKLNDRDAATEGLSQILTLNPTYLPALRSLGRIHALEGRWRALADMHRRELEMTRSPRRRVDLLFRIAQLREERLGELDGAVEAYEALLEIEPGDVAAARALSDLYARRGETEKLANLLLAEAERIEVSVEKAEAFMQVAELYEERLDRGDKAAELYQRVLKLGCFVDASTRALVRIYSREGMWNALAGALHTAADRAEDTKTEAAVLVRLAHVQRENLKNQDVAAELLERASQLMPQDRSILEQLERVSVARRDWARAVEVGERLADMETDARSYAARHIGLATLEQTQFDPPRSGAEHYRKALQALPAHPVALRALETAYRSARDWEGLAAINVREATTSAAHPRHRAGLLVHAAELYEERLEKPEMAAQHYDQALEADPHYLPALRGRRRLAEQLGQTSRAFELLEVERRLTVDQELSSALTFESGRLLQDRLGDLPKAIESYRKVLEAEPQNLKAFNRLEAIFLEQEDFPRMYQLLQDRAHAVDSSEEKARLLVSAGRIAEERMDDRAEAMGVYHSALEREPQNAGALIRLGPLLFAERRWAEAVDIFHRTLAVTKEVETLRDTFKALGIIYQEHLRDLVKSVQSFQAALQSDPRDAESLHRLAALYRGARDWGSAVNVMLRLAEIEPDTEGKTTALLQLAELYLDGLKDASHAINALRKALELDPACRPALVKLSELHETREEWDELVEVAGAYVSLLSPEERSEAMPLHLRMADVFERRLGDDHRAINALRYVLEENPHHEQALYKLATLYGKRVETYPQAVEVHRRILSVHPFSVDSYHELHRIFERLGQHDRAFVAAEILVFLQAHTPEEYVYFQENKIFVAQMAERQLTPEQHSAWVVHPTERGTLRAIFELLAPELGRAFPGKLHQHDLRRENRLGARSGVPVRVIADELTAMLRVPAYEMWMGRPDDVDVYTENERPPVLIVGGRFAKRLPPKNQRFLLGRSLERIKGGHLLFDAASDQDLEALLWSVVKLGQPHQQVPIRPSALEEVQRTLLRHISTRTRRFLEDIARQLPVKAVDLAAHRQGAEHTANRAGLVAANDIETAIRAIARGRPNLKTVFSNTQEAVEVLGQVPEVRDLLAYAMSDEYFEARARLGFSIQDG